MSGSNQTTGNANSNQNPAMANTASGGSAPPGNTPGALVPFTHNPIAPVPPPTNINPNALINPIPELAIGVAEFNSVPAGQPPYRDVPSIILKHLNVPDLTAAEPDWNQLLTYFQTRQAIQGIGNLQDLVVFIIRIALPNVIFTNRRHMQVMYSTYPQLPVACRLRYDDWARTNQATVHPRSVQVKVPAPPSLPLDYNVNIVSRPIFRGRLTPGGTQFIQWLRIAPAPLLPNQPVPAQMAHRQSEVDHYLDFSETTLRGLTMGELTQFAIRSFTIFWWISGNNARFDWYRNNNWASLDGEL